MHFEKVQALHQTGCNVTTMAISTGAEVVTVLDKVHASTVLFCRLCTRQAVTWLHWQDKLWEGCDYLGDFTH